MNFASYVFDKINQAVSDPYAIKELPDTNWTNSNLIKSTDFLSLHSLDGYYDVLLLNLNKKKSLFRLCHLHSSRQTEAHGYYNQLSSKLLVLCKSSNACFDITKLSTICSIIRTRSFVSPAHIAVEVDLVDVFRNGSTICNWINSQSCEKHYTPLHLACQLKLKRVVIRLIECEVDMSKRDDDGNTALHLSVIQENLEIIECLCVVAGSSVMNVLNNVGETALHIACRKNKVEICNVLLRGGANPLQQGVVALPIHYALKHGSRAVVEVLLKHDQRQVNKPCSKHGGVPFHWCKTKEDVKLLFQYYAPADILSKQGHLPLHIMVLRSRLEAAIAIILGNADVNGKGQNGNTALHLAVTYDHANLVKMLLLFGADAKVENEFGETPSLLALRSSHPNKEKIRNMLSCIGEPLVEPQLLNQNCNHKKQAPASDVEMAQSNMTKKLKVLCLDGGGIRGLVSTQLLMAIEKFTGQKCKDLFDWIAGTSTGGILAIALAQGRSAVDAQKIYFRLKDEIFTGSRPYNSKPMEEFLKREFGENATMEDLCNGPKLLITATLSDRKPVQLHIFKNYVVTDKLNFTSKSSFSTKLSVKDLTKLNSFEEPALSQPLWKVARCSGAAPTYFRPMKPYLDGGLIANNPTLDAIAEIHRYAKASTKTGQEKVANIGTVVSIGTGSIKTKVGKSVDVFRATNPVAMLNSALAGLELLQLMIDVTCETDNHIVDRARAWCEMIGASYFRMNPLLEDDISLDETNDEKLVDLLWEAQLYLHENKDLLLNLVHEITDTRSPMFTT